MMLHKLKFHYSDRDTERLVADFAVASGLTVAYDLI